MSNTMHIAGLRGLAVVAAAVLIHAVPVSAQVTTERYIPIGQSPGVSGKYSYVGRIVAMDESSHLMTVEDSKGRHQIKVTGKTQIWLDRNKSKRRNTTASYEDCEVGRRVEVMYTHEDKKVAKWIKIEE